MGGQRWGRGEGNVGNVIDWLIGLGEKKGVYEYR